MSLPTDAKTRKNLPIARGVLDYFPDAIAAVADVSRIGNEQHNPGEPMHWAKEKSTDHADCIARHLIDRGKRDADGTRHSAKLAWRALALLQIELDAEQATPEAAADEPPWRAETTWDALPTYAYPGDGGGSVQQRAKRGCSRFQPWPGEVLRASDLNATLGATQRDDGVWIADDGVHTLQDDQRRFYGNRGGKARVA